MFDHAVHHFGSQGIEWLVLGGSVGCKRDGLLKLKTGVSSIEAPFRVWKWKVDETNSCELSESIETSGDMAASEFFPAYRCRRSLDVDMQPFGKDELGKKEVNWNPKERVLPWVSNCCLLVMLDVPLFQFERLHFGH